MSDLPANDTTPASITIGGSLDSTIGPQAGGDRDWVRIDLTEGDLINITVSGRGANALNDSIVQIRDADGILLEFNDDAGDSLNSALLFLTPDTGTYYINIRGYDATEQGDYTLAVTEGEMPVDVLPALDWGTAQADTDVTVFFAPEGRRFDGFTSEGFNEYEIARFEAAFDLIAAVTGLTFRTVDRSADADLRLVLDLDEADGDFLGYFNPPGERRAGVGVFDGTQWDREAGGSLDAGGYDFVTIVHELLHGLGLAHPHDNGGGSEVFPGVSFEFDDPGIHGLNQGVFTTMSYNTGYPAFIAGAENERWGFEFGPMALDIAVLQAKYGANMDTATGDDTYTLATRNRAGTFWSAIWDAGGVDEIVHDGAGAAVIDLRAATLRYEVGGGGFLSSVAGVAGGFTIAAGAVIENARGGAGRDVITGNDVANDLAGSRGRDRIAGGEGDDNLAGNGGADRLAGGAGADNLTGGGGADRFIFRAGDSGAGAGDFIVDFGRGGADRIDLRSFGGLDFIGTDDFSSTGTGEVRYVEEDETVLVSVDAEGDGTVELTVRLGDRGSLDAGDFLLG